MDSNQVLFLKPIGHVINAVTEEKDEDWGQVVSRIQLEPEFAPGLRELGSFSHCIVVTYLHQAQFDPTKHLVRRPRDLATMPLTGIFAQRAKHRPNPIGIPAVRILGIDQNALVVQGLDAIHDTPVLDLKPYYPVYDRVDNAQVPEWVDRLMTGYF